MASIHISIQDNKRCPIYICKAGDEWTLIGPSFINVDGKLLKILWRFSIESVVTQTQNKLCISIIKYGIFPEWYMQIRS